MDDFQVFEQWHDRCAVVTCSGELDLETFEALQECLRRVEGEEPTRVVIDLDAVTFIGSTGLNVLVAAHNRLGAERLRVVTQQPATLRLLRITGLDDVLVVLPVLAEAMP